MFFVKSRNFSKYFFGFTAIVTILGLPIGSTSYNPTYEYQKYPKIRRKYQFFFILIEALFQKLNDVHLFRLCYLPNRKTKINEIEQLSLSVKFKKIRHFIILFCLQTSRASAVGKLKISMILYTKLIHETSANISIFPFMNLVLIFTAVFSLLLMI